MPNLNFNFTAVNSELEEILLSTLKMYSKDSHLDLLKKKQTGKILSRTEQSKLALCSELLVGQITVDRRQYFLGPIKSFLDGEISVGEFECKFLFEIENLNQELRQSEKSLDIPDFSLSMPQFRNGICELMYASAFSEFQNTLATTNDPNFHNFIKFIKQQDTKSEDLKLSYINFAQNVYNLLT